MYAKTRIRCKRQSQADQNLVTDAGLLSRSVPSAKELILNLVATESFLARLP